MRKHIENRHIVDTLFVLTLFAVFAENKKSEP